MKKKHISRLNIPSMSKKADFRGFTIVELLIVIIVIAILAAITIVAYNGVQKNAAMSLTKDTLQKASTLMLTQEVMNGSVAQSFPTGLTVPPKVGLALATPSDTSSFCINGTYKQFNIELHLEKSGQIENGLCSGSVIAGTALGDYSPVNTTTPNTSVVTVTGDGGGLTAKTDANWGALTISWNAVSGASRYEVQLRPSPTASWYVRRINGESASNSNGDLAGYQNDSSFSGKIPTAVTSITWHGTYAIPSAIEQTFEYRFRSYDGSGVASAWNTVSLSPIASSSAKVSNFTAVASSDWNAMELSWVQPTGSDIPAPVMEVQLRPSPTDAWYVRRISGESASNSNGDLAGYQNDNAFSGLIPITTTSITWHGSYAMPSAVNTTFEYRARLKSTAVTGLYGDWVTTTLPAPSLNTQVAVPIFTATPSGDWSSMALNWTAPNNPVMAGPVYEIQLRTSLTDSTWWLRRISSEVASNPNADISGYQANSAFSALIPGTTNTITWHGANAIPSSGQTYEYRIRQKSTLISGLYSPWKTMQLSH